MCFSSVACLEAFFNLDWLLPRPCAKNHFVENFVEHFVEKWLNSTKWTTKCGNPGSGYSLSTLRVEVQGVVAAKVEGLVNGKFFCGYAGSAVLCPFAVVITNIGKT
jgi:hypothetical protein